MSDTNTTHGIRLARVTSLAAMMLVCAAASLRAQQIVATPPHQETLLSSVSEISSAAALPDAPSAVLAAAEGTSSSVDPATAQTPGGPIVPPDRQVAPIHSLSIQPGWQAARLTGRDKDIISVEETYGWTSLAGYVLAGAYAHVTNGMPNYGTNGKALGQRIGASALRGASEDLLADGLLASAFHEDPRYYVEGDSYSFAHRVFYAAMRPLVTQSDSGHKRVNASLLLGYLGASALTVAYYPQINRNGADVGRTYGSSLGGAAISYLYDEFIGDVVGAFHHKQ